MHCLVDALVSHGESHGHVKHVRHVWRGSFTGGWWYKVSRVARLLSSSYTLLIFIFFLSRFPFIVDRRVLAMDNPINSSHLEPNRGERRDAR